MDIVDYEIDDRPEVADATLLEWEGKLEDKPEIEQTLFKLQSEWYNEKDDRKKVDVWTKMFENVRIYARSMVLQKLKNKKFLSPDIIEDYINESSLRFMSQYLYRRNFKCGASFGKMINYKVLEAVYGDKEEDKVLSLIVDSDSSDLDLLSMQEKANIKPILSQDHDTFEDLFRLSFKEVLDEILDEIDEEVDDDIIRLKCRFYINFILKKPKNRHVKSQFIKLCCSNKKEIDMVNLVELELLKRMKKHLGIVSSKDFN